MKLRIYGIFALFLGLFVAISCNKDFDTPLPLDDAPPKGVLTIDKVKKSWYATVSVGMRTEGGDLGIVPLWGQAVETKFRGEEDIVLVPFTWEGMDDPMGAGKVVMVFYSHPQSGEVGFKFLGYYSDQGATIATQQFDVNTFTGYLFNVDWHGNPANILKVENGYIVGLSPGGLPSGGGADEVDFRCDDLDQHHTLTVDGNPSGPSWCCNFLIRTCCGVPCAPASGSSSGGNFWSGIGGVLGNIFGGETSDPSPTNPIIINWGLFILNPGVASGGELNGGSGGGNRLSTFFDSSIFNAVAPNPAHVEIVEQFRVENNFMSVSTSILLAIIDPYCFDELDSFDGCATWSILNWLSEQVGLTPEQRIFLESEDQHDGVIGEMLSLFLDMANAGLSLEEISLVFDGLGSGRHPCVAESDLTFVGDAVYINFSNFAYNWYQHSTSLTYATVWPSFCIQFRAGYSSPTIRRRLKLAFESAVVTTEAQLLRIEKLSPNPILSTDLIKSEYRSHLKNALEATFGGAASINTFSGGCPGIGITPYRTTGPDCD